MKSALIGFRVKSRASTCLAVLAFVGAISTARLAFGRDVWVIRVVGIGPTRSDGNPQLWTDEAWLHNRGTVTESMRLVEASNGVVFPISDPLPIEPGRTVFPGQQNVWFLEVPMSVFHLDVGDDVIVASRLVSQANVPVVIDPHPPFPAFGAAPLPVFYEIPEAGANRFFSTWISPVSRLGSILRFSTRHWRKLTPSSRL